MSQKGLFLQASPTTAWPVEGGTFLPRHWAEVLGFLSSLPSPAATVRVTKVRRPYPLDTEARAHPPRFKDGKPPTGAQAQAAAAEGAGGHPSFPGSPRLLSQSHCIRPSWPLGMGEAGHGGGWPEPWGSNSEWRGLQKRMPREDQGSGSHQGGAYCRHHCHLSEMKSSEVQVSEGACPSLCS